jgi:hypothetical protein
MRPDVHVLVLLDLICDRWSAERERMTDSQVLQRPRKTRLPKTTIEVVRSGLGDESLPQTD